MHMKILMATGDVLQDTVVSEPRLWLHQRAGMPSKAPTLRHSADWRNLNARVAHRDFEPMHQEIGNCM